MSSLSINNLKYNGLNHCKERVVPIPSWDGLASVTSIDSNIRSLKKVIAIYFILFLEINERTRRLAPYRFWDSQVTIV